jgi:outer membrane lipoprotein-sorting protein
MLLRLALAAVWGQEIQTAFSYFDLMSERYGSVEDYEADIVITTSSGVMEGVLFYKNPNLLRINFTKPADQVLVVDGEKLVLYIPELRVIMEQRLKKRSSAGVASLASAQGLNLLKKRYSISYLSESGSIPVPLDPVAADGGRGSSAEMVVKFKLEWRSTDEGFRQIELCVDDKSKLIRRIVGISSEYERIQIDFLRIRTNIGIPNGRFRYDSPNTANVYNNFLFEPEE